jgi:hypothetical protein
MRAMPRAHVSRHLPPALDHVPTARDRSAVVEAAIERFLMKAAPIKRRE